MNHLLNLTTDLLHTKKKLVFLLRIFCATLLSVVDGCRWITFNLPSKPQTQTQIIKDLDEAKFWEAIVDKSNG